MISNIFYLMAVDLGMWYRHCPTCCQFILKFSIEHVLLLEVDLGIGNQTRPTLRQTILACEGTMVEIWLSKRMLGTTWGT